MLVRRAATNGKCSTVKKCVYTQSGQALDCLKNCKPERLDETVQHDGSHRQTAKTDILLVCFKG